MSIPLAPTHVEGANRPDADSEADMPGNSTRTLWATAIPVAALVVTMNAWATRHLGWGLENMFGISSIAAGVGIVVALFDKIIPENEVKQLKFSLLKIPSIYVICLWIVFGAVAAMRSSVVVVRDSIRDTAFPEATVLSELNSNGRFAPDIRETEDKSVRFTWVPTTPFGRAYRLKVPGYVEQVLQVYPLTGLTVIPERDLRVSPSVLFRPSMTAVKELDPVSGGKFQVLLVTGKSAQSLIVSCHKSSFLLGSEQEVPAAWPAMWELELAMRASSVPASQSNNADTMLAWLRYTLLQPPHDLAPGTVLEGRVVSKGNAIVASARATLRAEPLIDVPLLTQTSAKLLSAEEVPPCPKE